MAKLFCSSCNAKSIDDGKTILYECKIRTEDGFEYTDWYKEPKEVGYHVIDVAIRNFQIISGNKIKTVYKPIARLGNFLNE